MFEWCTRSLVIMWKQLQKSHQMFLPKRRERYHKRCIYCNSKWLFFTLPFHTAAVWCSQCVLRLGSAQYLATATCQEVYLWAMDSYHDFIIAFDYLMLYISNIWVLSHSAPFFRSTEKSFISWLVGWSFLILCINFGAAQNFGIVPCCFFYHRTIFFPYSYIPSTWRSKPILKIEWTLSSLSSRIWYLSITGVAAMLSIHINNDLLSKSLAFAATNNDDDDGNRIRVWKRKRGAIYVW